MKHSRRALCKLTIIITAFSIITLSIMPIIRKTLGIMTLSLKTPSAMIFSGKTLKMTLNTMHFGQN
jgi:hypothetical protein